MRANRLSFPKVRHCYNRAPRADYPDRPRPLHDNPFAFGSSVQHPVAARLVVGPDVVRDVGVGNERYDTVVPSGNGSVRKSMVVTTDAGQPTPAPRESSLGIRASLLTRAKFFRHEGSCRSPRGDTRLLRLSATLVGTFYPLGHC